MRITRPFVLLALAALLAPRIEASRTSVWESNPPTAVVLAKADATSALAALAPAVRLDTSTTVDSDIVDSPRFDLGDVVLVERELEREEHFNLGPLTLVDLNLLRGPPSSYPEARVRGFELLPPFRVGASPTLSLWSRQACGFVCLGLVSDSPEDPWGLQVLPEGSENDPFIARAVLEANKETRSTEELRKENDALLNFVSLINKPVAVARAAYNVFQDARHGRFTVATALDSLFLATQVKGGRVPVLRAANREGPKAIQAAEEAGLPARSAQASGEIKLTPYGDGLGHHLPAKSAFRGDPAYKPRQVLAISNAELERLGVSHARITGAQQTLYRQFADTGKKLGWDEMRAIERQALVVNGVPAGEAASAVDRAIAELQSNGVRAPARIPWGG